MTKREALAYLHSIALTKEATRALEQLRVALMESPDPSCPHPPDRRLTDGTCGGAFLPRDGCLDCDTWLSPKRLR